MRTLTTQQTATLTSKLGYRCRARVRVLRGSTWYDLTDLLTGPGWDFLEEVNWSESTEGPCATAQVRCLREVNGVSLAPLVTNSVVNLVSSSYSPLLKEGRTFVVETSVAPLGQSPSTWTEVFRGRIDEVDSGGDVTFTGRSYIWGNLQDTGIETERTYGSDTGVDVQTVMQAILNDNGLTAFTLYWPSTPSWALKKYVQKGEPVADALLTLARQLGWELREKWLSSGPNTGGWYLTLYSPNRSASSAAWTFTAAEYERLEEVRTSLADVRNVVEVVYSDSADRDAAGEKKRKTVVRTDSASIAAYGRRFMRIAEAATSNVDTATEAGRLADAGLADLKDVPLGLAFQVLHHPGLELGDMVAVEGNGKHFSGTQTAAVQALSHSFNAGGCTTKLTLVGKPSLGRRTWLDREQRPGVAPASPFTGPDTVSSLSVVETTQGVRVRFNAPVLGPVASAYELHVSTTSGFTPSDTTRRVVGSLTEMTVPDLTPGTTYYLRVVPRDSKGNRGTASSQVSFTPRYVEPRFMQPLVEYATLPSNPGFEAANDVLLPPDTWAMDVGTWGVDAVVDSSVVASGARAVKLNGTLVAARIKSAPFACAVNDLVLVRAKIFNLSSVEATTVYVRWLNASLTTISESLVATASDSVTFLERVGKPVRAPSGALYAQVVIGKDSAFTSYAVYLDSVRVTLVPKLTSGGGISLTYENSFTSASGHPVEWWVTPTGTAVFRGAINRASTPASGTRIAMLPVAPVATHYAPVASDTDTGAVYVETDGGLYYVRGAVTGRLWLSALRFQIV